MLNSKWFSLQSRTGDPPNKKGKEQRRKRVLGKMKDPVTIVKRPV
jgi:hypothetical protein